VAAVWWAVRSKQQWETQHHIIVAHDVTIVGLDRRLLTPIAKRAKAALAQAPDRTLRAVADLGYYPSQDLLACDEAGIATYVAKTDTSGQSETRDGDHRHQTLASGDSGLRPVFRLKLPAWLTASAALASPGTGP
jgi:hypothetical protein